MASNPWGLSWSPPAIQDRNDIYNWNKAYSQRSAKATDELIAQTIKSIRQYPHLGRVGRVQGTRERVLKGGKYLIVYRVDDQAKRVEIVTVVSTAQQFP